MQLYKNRNFSEYFSDTFAFIKQHGKHFYTYYFSINGIFLLILMVMMYFFGKFYFNLALSGVENSRASDPLASTLTNNPGAFLLFGLVFGVLIVLFSIINYAYTPAYFIAYESHENSSNFTRKELATILKSKIGKLILFVLTGILVLIPLGVVVGIIAVILTVTIIGVFALPFLLAWVMQFYFFALMIYLKEDRKIFECFTDAFHLSLKNPWASLGSVVIFYMITQVVQGIVILIPYVLGILQVVTGVESSAPNQNPGSLLIVIMTLLYVVSFALNMFLLTVIQTNQSIIFFSLKESAENINAKNQIDQIGNS